MNRFLTLVMVLGLGALGFSGAAEAGTRSCTMPGNAAALTAAAAGAMNASRAVNGRGALSRNPTLDAVAQAHACWMATTGKFSHKGKSGSSPWRRVKGSGYCARVAAENIALGHKTGAFVNQRWMDSAGHRRNILLPSVREYGMGVALQNGKPVWVAVYAKPC